MEEQDKIIIEDDENWSAGETAAKNKVRVLSFKLGSENYAVNITDAREVFRPASITKVPNMPSFIVGVTNWHGEVMPLIDIRYLLGLTPKEGLSGMKAIVTDMNTNPISIIVDEVGEAVDIEEESIQPPLATIKGSLAAFTKGQVRLGDEILVLLELKKIMSCTEIESLKRG